MRKLWRSLFILGILQE
jgi:hypothetical protein